MGADAILLITTLLEASQLSELLSHSRDVGLQALVETHEERDVEKALKSGALIIGVNHRDLRTLQMDMSRARRLLPMIPKDKIVVVESGIKDPVELPAFRHLGAHAVLIGETLMRDSDAKRVVESFVAAGRRSEAVCSKSKSVALRTCKMRYGR
jgi:indole-3-glycerol phosphate synthase